jgi:hypothetical protein
MRLFIFLIFLFVSCSQSTEVKERIRGKWHFDDSKVYIKITRDEYIVKNDSPYPEDYKFINDSTIVKGFEASIFPWKYWDTMKIVRLTSDTLILRDSDETIILYKK